MAVLLCHVVYLSADLEIGKTAWAGRECGETIGIFPVVQLAQVNVSDERVRTGVCRKPGSWREGWGRPAAEVTY